MRFLSTAALLVISTAPALGRGLPMATYSIVAYDPAVEEWGVAVQSKFLAVGAVVPYARAKAGAVASQAWGHPNFGPQVLDLLGRGLSADSALKAVVAADSQRDYRQLGIVDAKGDPANFTGRLCQPYAGGLTGQHYCVQGNILAQDSVLWGMAQAFENSSGPLARRLVAALYGGQRYGGDRRGMQSAALLVVSEGGGYSGYNDRMIDLRVDDDPQPIVRLEELLDLHEKIFGAGAYLRIGLAALKQGREEKAGILVDRAMSIAAEDSNNAVLLNQVAWELAIHDYKLAQALRLAERAARLEPGDADIIDTWAECLARSGDYKKAVEMEKKAYAISQNPEFGEKIKVWSRKLKR